MKKVLKKLYRRIFLRKDGGFSTAKVGGSIATAAGLVLIISGIPGVHMPQNIIIACEIIGVIAAKFGWDGMRDAKDSQINAEGQK